MWRDVAIHAFMQPPIDRFVPRDDGEGVAMTTGGWRCRRGVR